MKHHAGETNWAAAACYRCARMRSARRPSIGRPHGKKRMAAGGDTSFVDPDRFRQQSSATHQRDA
eukprot:2428233-Alexandrium_andersonii.AAC.1